MTTITMEELVHSHYANGRGMALMTAGAGLVGLAFGGMFLSSSSYTSDLQVGGAIALVSLVVVALGGAWFWLRLDPKRSGLYTSLVTEADRVLWVYRTRRNIMFHRNDGTVVGIPITWPGPARFQGRDLDSLFAATYPRALQGFSDENARAYGERMKMRG